MPRQPRQTVLLGDARQRCDRGRRQRPRAAHVDIESVAGGCDLDVERLSGWRQRFGDRPSRIKRAA